MSGKAAKMEAAMGLRQRYWSPDGGGFRLGVLRERVAAMRSAVSGFRAWAHWCGSRRRVESDAMLSAWLPEALKAGLSSGQLVDAFEKAFFTGWTDAVVESEPCLAGFFQQVHETSIEDFRNFDEEYRHLSSRYVHARLAAEVPQVHAGMAQPGGGSEMGTLMRELQKQRRHLPVRRLLELIPNLMRRLKPCLLMSPLSVAQYLPANGEPYDIVVFDEASQIPPWDALGAFARGRTAVVVGDPKQLPPTGFFQKDLDADADDETLDLESILDECIAARLPCLRLGWHYRSRHESLIAFSNHRYYRNSLLTFPSVDQALAVKHIEVPDAVYDKGRSQTNRKEAERVVEEIVSRLGDPSQSRRSLGVVTFSMAQQRLIEELLDKERAARPEIEAAFSDARLEPVFVKNLESVQGDERDVVIFSIGYGPDREGRVSMNFGPLNRNGGPRRLNVAITRAREEVVVVSALLPEHIDLTRTNAAG
ncbi:MAG TPA: DEAD/DEAH box helicase, partial [Bacteroidia bacterium]|nr:DEAD/DEAH box helicase [Bacteroidia bacterium]